MTLEKEIGLARRTIALAGVAHAPHLAAPVVFETLDWFEQNIPMPEVGRLFIELARTLTKDKVLIEDDITVIGTNLTIIAAYDENKMGALAWRELMEFPEVGRLNRPQ